MGEFIDEPQEMQDELDGAEEDPRDYEVKSVNDHVVILVDARRNMFESMSDHGQTCFNAAIQMATRLMKTKIVESRTSKIGVTLFGTKGKSDDGQGAVLRLDEDMIRESVRIKGTSRIVKRFRLDFLDEKQRIAVHLELSLPSAKGIRDLEVLPRTEKGFDKKYGLLGEEESCPLRSGLWSCQSELTTIKNPADVKRIFVFTNDDDPLRGNEEETKKVQIITKDIAESSIEIQLFHMKRRGTDFDPNKFYLQILASDGDEFNEQALGGGTGAALELLDRVRRREYKKRTLGQLPFYVCEGLRGRENQTQVSFDVKLYTMIYPASKGTPISLDARRNKPIRIISKYMDDKTGAQLDDHEIRRYFYFGGERAYVTPDEIASLKAVSSKKGLVLLGFKEVGTLRNDFNIRSPYFIYPDEEGMTGSAKAFIALHTAMLKKGVYALARLTARDKAASRMAALLPQEEEVEDGLQISPPGLHVVLLPFADEIREAKTIAGTEVNREEKAVPVAEALIQALQLDGLECHRFDNPVLQRHYAAIQAIALSEEEVSWDPEKDDNTRPDDQGIDAATAGLVVDFNEALGGDEEDDVPVPRTKRPAAGGASGAKRVKVEGNGDDIDWKACVATGEINGMVVATLKAYLKAQGLTTSGKKADLVERIRLHVASG